MLLAALDELLWVLRREGFSISTAQAIDVARVAELVGFDDRATLRDALGAVILERASQRAAFVEVFDRFFALDKAHATDLWGRLRERGFDETELGALRELLEAAAQRSSGDASAWLPLVASDADLDRLLLSAGIARALAPMTSALQIGFFAQRASERVGVPRAASALARLEGALREALGDERGRALAGALAEELERVRRRVRRHVEREAELRTRPPGDGSKRREDKPFFALVEAEMDEVRRAVRRLAERLRGAERVRRKRARRGHLDPHRTLRASFRTFGVPFTPARKRRRRDRPKLFVLCDVSDSVRTASLFLLELANATQELFAGTRTFVFVSELGETTELFRDQPIERALAKIYAGGVVSAAHNSNYGRVLVAFEERFGASVDKRSTILILGDGRTNYLADEAETVARLRDRARALLWITPEGPGTWATGDSAMTRYAAASTRVLVARTARELEVAAREVVARRK